MPECWIMAFRWNWLLSSALTLTAAVLCAVAFESVLVAETGRASASNPTRADGAVASQPGPAKSDSGRSGGRGSEPSRREWAGRREGGGKGGKNSSERAGRSEDAATDKQPLRPEEIEEFLAFAQQHFPRLHSELERARKEDARAFKQMLRRVAPPMRRLIRLWREDPVEAENVIQIQNVEMMIREQKRLYHTALDSATREAAKVAIRKHLEVRFDLRRQKLEREIANLRTRLDEQTRRLAEQGRNKQTIIDDEFTRVLESALAGPADPKGQGSTPRPQLK